MVQIKKIDATDTLNSGRQKINTAIDALVNSEGNTVNVGFNESFDTLADLKTKYPSGASGMFFVFNNGNSDGGHSYMWVDGTWKDLGIYQGKEIADGSVTPSKLADKAGTLDKITTIGRNATLASMIVNEKLNFDYKSYEVIIPSKIRLLFDNKYTGLDNQNTLKMDRNTAINILVFSTLRNDLRIVNPTLDMVREFEYIIAMFDTREPKIEFCNAEFLVNDETYLSGIVPEQNLSERIRTADLTGAFLTSSKSVRDISDELSWVNSNNYSFQNNQIVINAGGWAFPSTELTNDIYMSISAEGISPSNISVGVRDSNLIVIENFKPVFSQGIAYFTSKDIDMPVTGKTIEFRFDNRGLTDQMVVNNFLVGKSGIPTKNSQLMTNIVYIDANASKSGDGSFAHPFKTITEGINVGAETIAIQPGIYHESISVSGRNKLRLVGLQDDSFSTSKPDREGVKIVSAENISFTKNGSIFASEYSAKDNSRLKKVFLDKTLPPTESNGRSIGYNACLWEINGDPGTDTRLIPVLSKNDCENTPSSFFYDGINIFIHPKDNTVIDKQFWLSKDVQNSVKLINITELELVNIRGLFGYEQPMFLQNNQSVKLISCEASYSALSDGFSLDYSNGQLIRCEAYRNRNDGFNFHFFGDTHLIDCTGNYNYDDGNSHHDGCTGSIRGGEYAFNGKGGCSPTYGAQISLYDVYSHDNTGYGLLTHSDPENKWRKIRVFGCAFKNNGVDIHINRYTLISKNNSYDKISCVQGVAENLITV